MSARRPSNVPPPEDPGAPGGSLQHNPFAALRGVVGGVAGTAGGDVGPRAAATGAAPESAPASKSPSAAGSPPRAEHRGRVTVRRERSGRGGKTVTVAEGPGLAAHDLAKLAREVASALGLGARVEDHGLVLQGDQRGRLAGWLAARGFSQVVRGN